jgi:hypothetical protein
MTQPAEAGLQTPKYRVVPISSWRQFQEIVEGEDYRSWGFRGQADAQWPLYSSLSRYLIDTAGGRTPFVIIGEPKVMNRRLIAQSGTFVIPGVLDEPIEQILSDYDRPDRLLTKFVLETREMRETAMRGLYNTNLTYATLFPDLDGLARSMAYELEFHWAFSTLTMKPYPGFPPPSNLLYWGTKKKR